MRAGAPSLALVKFLEIDHVLRDEPAGPLGQLISEAGQVLGADAITIFSGYRDAETQQGLWDDALAKYGSTDAARQWVAPSDGLSCSSQHCQGLAADLAFSSPAVQAWAHANADRFGLTFPMPWESWHIEPAGSR